MLIFELKGNTTVGPLNAIKHIQRESLSDKAKCSSKDALVAQPSIHSSIVAERLTRNSSIQHNRTLINSEIIIKNPK